MGGLVNLIFVLLVVRLSQGESEIPPQVMEMVQACMETNPVDPESLEIMKQTGSIPDESNSAPKCFLNCLMEKTKIYDGASYNKEALGLALKGSRGGVPMNQTWVADLAGACIETIQSNNDPDKCENSYGIMKCIFLEQIKETGPGDFIQS